MPYNITPEENDRTLQRLFVALEGKGDMNVIFLAINARASIEEDF
jgi:hypothetical protein